MNDAGPIVNLSRWAWMWLAAGAMFFAGKAAKAWPLRRALGWKRLLAFTFLWAGMDARAFLPKERGRLAPCLNASPGAKHPRSLGAIAVNIAAGAGLTNPLASGWCRMVGLILLLHFGIFAALAFFWRARVRLCSHLLQTLT